MVHAANIGATQIIVVESDTTSMLSSYRRSVDRHGRLQTAWVRQYGLIPVREEADGHAECPHTIVQNGVRSVMKQTALGSVPRPKQG